jgi:hypothetical protein
MADQRSGPPPRAELGREVTPPPRLANRSAEVESYLSDRWAWRSRLFLASILRPWSIVLGFALGATIAVLAANEENLWLAGLLAVAAIINLAILGLARATRSFAWFGVAIFLSVPVFGAVVGGVRTYKRPQIQPAALVRKSDNVGVCGIYITETDKRVYMGRVEPLGHRGETGTGRIFWVPVENVDMLKIGAPQGAKAANERAPALLRELYADRAEDTGTELKPTTTSVQTTKGGKVTTVKSEAAPHPPQRARPRASPKTEANACTDVRLGSESSQPGQPPVDDSPQDP